MEVIFNLESMETRILTIILPYDQASQQFNDITKIITTNNIYISRNQIKTNL